MKKILFLLLPCVIFANPHFFVDVDLKVEQNIIHFDWKFDRINSALLFFEFDTNKNKTLDKEEELAMIKKFFTPLKKDNYHLMIQLDEELEPIPNNVAISYIQKRLHIAFDILVNDFNNGVICNIDPVVYFAFKLKKVSSTLLLDKQIDKYDFCIGVSK